MNRRALVELKALSATQFTKRDRGHMRAAAKFYGDAVCLLYVKKPNAWYFLEPHSGLTKIAPPIPGGIGIDQLPQPKLRIPVWYRYGRSYFTRPSTLVIKKTADGLDFIVKSFFYSPRRRNKK